MVKKAASGSQPGQTVRHGEITEYFSDQYYPRYRSKVVHVTSVYYLDNRNGNFYDGNTKRKIGKKVMMSTQ